MPVNQTPDRNNHTIKSIVLVDDEPSVLFALKLLLGALGFTVTDFGDPKKAVEFLNGGGSTDLVLSDLRMPGLDGIGVLKAVRMSHPDLPFVLISGHATESDVAKAQEQGVTAFLGKPFSPDELRALIQSIEHSP